MYGKSQVSVRVEEIDLDGDHDPEYGEPPKIPSLCLTCNRCEHSVEVYGQTSASLKRGMVMLREGCPKGESNYYVSEDDPT